MTVRIVKRKRPTPKRRLSKADEDWLVYGVGKPSKRVQKQVERLMLGNHAERLKGA